MRINSTSLDEWDRNKVYYGERQEESLTKGKRVPYIINK